jgi:type IV pilus assembly protein PilA
MISKMRSAMRNEEGFTLIELMIVVAIIGILAAVAVPNFISYRDRSRVASAVATAGSIRAALAAYASDQSDTTYPGSYTDYSALATDLNKYGANLPVDSKKVGIASISYSTNTDKSSYTVTITTEGVANDVVGKKIVVTPEGVTREKGSS